MAYPTLAQLNFKAVDDALIGAQPIMEASSVKKHPLGTIVKGTDFGSLNYGQAEFVYLQGVASTAAGDAVIFDPVAGTSVRTVVASRGPVAVAMAPVGANQFGWYAVRGSVPVSTASAGTGAANPQLAVTATAGQLTVGSAVAGLLVSATCKSAQDTPSAGFTQVQLAVPSTMNITATGEAVG